MASENFMLIIVMLAMAWQERCPCAFIPCTGGNDFVHSYEPPFFPKGISLPEKITSENVLPKVLITEAQ